MGPGGYHPPRMETWSASDGDVESRMVSGAEAVSQRVGQQLLTLRAEYFADRTIGLPYLADVLGANVDVARAERAITAEILLVEGVQSVSDAVVTLDDRARRIDYAATCHTIYGPIPVAQTVG